MESGTESDNKKSKMDVDPAEMETTSQNGVMEPEEPAIPEEPKTLEEPTTPKEPQLEPASLNGNSTVHELIPLSFEKISSETIEKLPEPETPISEPPAKSYPNGWIFLPQDDQEFDDENSNFSNAQPLEIEASQGQGDQEHSDGMQQKTEKPQEQGDSQASKPLFHAHEFKFISKIMNLDDSYWIFFEKSVGHFHK